MSRILAACRTAAAGLLAALLVPAQSSRPAGTVARGEHFEVRLDFEADHAAREALAVLETTWPLASGMFQAPALPAGHRLPVCIYRSVAAYQAVEARLTGGHFAQNLSFAHWPTGTAHVALQPAMSDDALRRLGLPAQTVRMLAHEAGHLVSYLAWPGHASHPFWLQEGPSLWLEREVLEAMDRPCGVVRDPWDATAILRVQELVRDGPAPSFTDLLLGRMGTVAAYARYDLAWAWFQFLQEERGPQLRELLQRVRGLQGGPGFPERLRDAALEVFGPAQVPALEQEFRAHLAAWRPAWQEVYRSLECRGDEWRQVAFAERNAIAWRTDSPGSARYVVQGELELLPGPRPQLNLLLGRRAEGFVSVAFSVAAGRGGVTVFAYDARADLFELKLEAVVPLRVGARTAFTADVAGDLLTITLAGQRAAQVELPGLLGDRAFGVGAQAGAAGIWHGVRCRPLADPGTRPAR